MPRHSWNRAAALTSTALLALTLAACGSESDSGAPTEAPTSTATTSTAGSPTGGSTSSGGSGTDETPSTTATGEESPTEGRAGPDDGTGRDGDPETGADSAPTSGGSDSGGTAATSGAANPAPDPEPVVTPSADPTQAASSRVSGTTAADTSTATSLSIPAVGLSTSISPQGLRGGKVNPGPGQVIWFTGNDRVRPGATGTSVIAGHVNNARGPDTFAALEQLETGDGVVLTYPGGEKLRLEITSTDVVGKDELRTDQSVWGANSDSRRVVLVTCDDQLGFREDGHRKANFVAVAELPS